jgi:hypothetical protein
MTSPIDVARSADDSRLVYDPQELANRYVAAWNEADAARRRNAVLELWTEDGLHVLQPPQAVRDAASDLNMTAIFQARGHAELLARVGRAYEKFVASGQFSFRARSNAVRVGDVVKFNWEMVSSKGEVTAVGLEFVVLAADGRIRLDHQFIEP